jgi:uncharacterized membrane protein YgdD (TMEM256/DUF423 family)
MNYRTALLTGISLAGLAVVFGAFGAHALKHILESNQRTDTFELAVNFQFYHALSLVVTGLLLRAFESNLLKYGAACFAIGILFFSGSLYILSLTNVKAFGAITPVGGSLFIAGWILLFAAILKKT